MSNSSKIKKQSCITFLLIAVMHLQMNIIKGQFIYRQADRAQIIYDYAINYPQLSGGSRDKRIYFDKPFYNIPKITLSIIWMDYSQQGSQGFHLEVVDVQKDYALIRVTTNGVIIKQLRICVLATDFPNSQLFKETNISGQSSKLYTAPGNILGYCAYFYGFKGDALSNTEMRFDFKSVQQDSKNILVNYDTNGVFGKNMISIDYNVLIIYEEDTFDSSLYSFIFMVGQNYSGSTMRSITFQTDLQDEDRMMYGFRYQYLKSGSGLFPQIINDSGTLDNPIRNKQLKLMIFSGSMSSQDGEVAIFQLIMKACPSNQYIIKDQGQYVCTSDCSSVNPRAYNDVMNKCTICNTACYRCQGPSDSDCTSCESGFFYDSVSFKCVSSKPEKYFCESKTMDSQTFQYCSPCDKSCQTCAGPLPNQCTSCPQRYYANIKR